MRLNYPTLNKALMLMLNDQGLDVDASKLSDIDRDTITPENLARAEQALAQLSQTELETICIGDQDDWDPIYEKLGAESENVSHVLDAMFETI